MSKQLTDAIWVMYKEDYMPKVVSKRLECELDYVMKLYNIWGKGEVAPDLPALDCMKFERPPLSNFVLMTNNPEVEAAHRRMVNGWTN